MSKRYTSSSIFSSVSLLIIVSVVILSSISIEKVTTENHPVYEENKMISKQSTDIRSSIRKKNTSKKNKSNIVNCYLKWDDHAEEKSYLEKMHNEIIKMPVEETLESLHKFGHLGYLREEACDGQSYVMKYLFSEAWSEDNNNNDSNDKKDGGYCKVSSDVLKARLPKVIKIIMQREKLEYNKKNKNKTTRLERQPQQQQKKKEEEDYSPRVKSLKDFVQLFEQKEKECKNPRIYVSY
jgi:hypothetical protein